MPFAGSHTTVSIIIPVLNEASTIATALEKVGILEGDPEVIVVDGGSADNTVELASRLARVISSPRGRAAQMNRGATAAKGDALLFLHADTSLPKGALACIGQALSDPRVVGGRFNVVLDGPGWAYRVIGFSINMRDRLIGGFTGDQAIFVRADAFRALGGYREMPLMEDLDLGRRMGRVGKIARVRLSVVTSARRWRSNGVARTIVLMWVLRFLYLLGMPPSRLSRFYRDTR